MKANWSGKPKRSDDEILSVLPQRSEDARSILEIAQDLILTGNAVRRRLYNLHDQAKVDWIQPRIQKRKALRGKPPTLWFRK